MAELPLSVPLDMAIRERVRSSAFGRDLQTLLQLAEDKLGAALAVLASAEGFVGPRRLPVLLQGVIEPQAAAAIGNFVVNFTLFGSQSGVSAQEVAAKFSTELQRLFGAMETPPVDLDRAAKLLEQLGQPFPAVVRQLKAGSLGAAVGETVSSLALICDLRPVFDDTGDAVSGFVPILTLKIGVDSGDDIERVLDVDQLGELEVLVRRARSKLAVLRGLSAGLAGTTLPEDWGDD